MIAGLSGLSTGLLKGFQDAKAEKARLEQQTYDRSRLDAADTRAQESHVAQMGLNTQSGKLNEQAIQSGQHKIDKDMAAYKQLNAWNAHATPMITAFEAGEMPEALNSLEAMSNDPEFKLPFTTKFVRGTDGNIAIGKDGMAKVIFTNQDGSSRETSFDPKNAVTAGMALQDPMGSAKLIAENDKETLKHRRELERLDKQGEIRTAEIKLGGKLDEGKARLVAQLEKNPDKPMTAQEQKLWFSTTKTTGTGYNAKSEEVMDRAAHAEWAKWLTTNKRSGSMNDYNRWVASKNGQPEPVVATHSQVPTLKNTKPSPMRSGVGQPATPAAPPSAAVQSILNNYQLPR